MQKTLITACAMAALTTGARAQNDECTGALPLTVGTTAFSTVGATTSFSWPCAAGGNDIWYRFTAPNSTTYRFDTCTGTGYDSALQLFSGDCANLVSIACNDDTCGLQSTVILGAATAGTDYYLRVGGFASQTGSGTLTVFEQSPGTPLSNQDDCANAALDTIGAGIWDWNNSGATTGAVGQNEAICYAFGVTGIQRDVWAVYDVGSNGPVTIGTCGALGSNLDTKIAVYPLGPCATIDGTAVACNDDACGGLSEVTFDAFCGQRYLLQLGSFGGFSGTSQLRITETGGGCGPGPIGTTPSSCNPAVPNSSALSAEISAFGSLQISVGDVRLSVTNVPPGEFGIFFCSRTIGFVPNPGGSVGAICVLGNQGRYRMPSQIYAGAGTTPAPPGGLQIGNLPVPSNPPLPGLTAETWYFQSWYRDVGPVNNFTNVVAITFVP